MMHDLRHPNVCSMVGAVWQEDLMALVMEFCDKGSLGDLLKVDGAKFTCVHVLASSWGGAPSSCATPERERVARE